MRIGLNYITALLPAGAASMAIAVAPRALALPTTAVPHFPRSGRVDAASGRLQRGILHRRAHR
jgi:hypothetical protein